MNEYNLVSWQLHVNLPHLRAPSKALNNQFGKKQIYNLFEEYSLSPMPEPLVRHEAEIINVSSLSTQAKESASLQG